MGGECHQGEVTWVEATHTPTSTPTATATPTPTATATGMPTATGTPTPTPRTPRFSVDTANPLARQRVVLKIDEPLGGNAHFGAVSWVDYDKCLDDVDDVQTAADCVRWQNIGYGYKFNRRYHYCRGKPGRYGMHAHLQDPRAAGVVELGDPPGFNLEESICPSITPTATKSLRRRDLRSISVR